MKSDYIDENGNNDDATKPLRYSFKRRNKEEFEAYIRKHAQKVFPGPNYLQWLQFFHNHLEPKRYLEIGIASGGSLARVSPNTLTIGIDPAFTIKHSIIAPTRLFRLESDKFFEEHDAKLLLSGTIDLSFVDGLHTFDQTFRDIVNVNANMHKDSVILVHDVAPLHERVARRDRVTDFWTGDVWKIGYMIKKLMPECDMRTIPTYPSGLMVIKAQPDTQIDPDEWAKLEAEVMDYPFPEEWDDMQSVINIENATPDSIKAWLKS